MPMRMIAGLVLLSVSGYAAPEHDLTHQEALCFPYAPGMARHEAATGATAMPSASRRNYDSATKLKRAISRLRRVLNRGVSWVYSVGGNNGTFAMWARASCPAGDWSGR